MCQCRASTARGLRLALGGKYRHVQDAHNPRPFTYNFELPRVWSVVVGDSPTPGVPTCQDSLCPIPNRVRCAGCVAALRGSSKLPTPIQSVPNSARSYQDIYCSIHSLQIARPYPWLTSCADFASMSSAFGGRYANSHGLRKAAADRYLTEALHKQAQ
jgi:hypothetical protein